MLKQKLEIADIICIMVLFSQAASDIGKRGKDEVIKLVLDDNGIWKIFLFDQRILEKVISSN